MRVYSWSSSGRSIPWFAVLLVVLGVGLLVEQFTDLGFGHVLILGFGIALGAAWLLRGIIGATVPALALTGWGLAGLGSDIGLLPGDGWTTLFIGVAFLVGWGLARYQNARRGWALWVGAILGVLGLIEVADALPEGVEVASLIAVALIGLGVWIVYQSRARARS